MGVLSLEHALVHVIKYRKHNHPFEKKMLEIASQKNPFKRSELSKKDALEFFAKKGDNFKIEIISELDESEAAISIYDEGDFTDLCLGPHIPDTSKIKFVI